MMLHKTKSPNTKQWKYALIIPLLIAFIALFNTKTIAQEKGEWEIKTSIESVELIIDKDYSDALLQQEAETFKNEFNIDLSFKGIKRNTVNEITAIKIDAKGANIKTSFKKSGTDPINPILISFNNENNAISIGHLSEEFDGAGMYNKPTYSNQENENSSGQYIFIASDGDGNTWTSKSDTIVNAEKIIINKNGNKEIIWVEKKIDSSNANVQVIEINSENNADTIKVIKSGDKSFIIEEDNASENVFIIKNNDGTIEKKVIETKVVNSDANDKPLILVNGKETSSEEMKKINPNDIESINVLKGENALKKYGEKAKNGVIEITKKK